MAAMCRWLVLILMLHGAGCGTSPQRPTNEQRIAVWLSEKPRQIRVEFSSNLPTPVLISRDHKAGERVAKGMGGGLLGAGYMVVQGCGMGAQGGGGYGAAVGCLLGVVLSPVGFIIGAVGGATSVKTRESLQPLAKQEGAESVIQPVRLEKGLKRLDTTTTINEMKPDGIRVDAGKPASSGRKVEKEKPATLRLHLSTLGFLGDVAEDPPLALALRGSAVLSVPDFPGLAFEAFEYEGITRPLSEWCQGGQDLFLVEFQLAAKKIGRTIALHMIKGGSSADITTKIIRASDPDENIAVPAGTD